MWLRIDDNAGHHPKFLKAGKNDDERNRRYGVWARLLIYCGQYRTDGYVPQPAVDAVTRNAGDLDALRRVRLIHRKGDRCPCRAGREWPDDAAVLLHDFLDRNPSRKENDVHRAKRRELRNPDLKAAVRDRDQGLCRYCGTAVNYHDHKSAAGGVIDHVDPAIAEGARNLATACRSCNSVKGKRTPDAAGMRLWPPGTTAETIAAVLATELAALVPDPDPIHDRSMTGSETVLDPVTDPATDPGTDPPPENREETDMVRKPPDDGAERPPAGVWLVAEAQRARVQEARRRRAAGVSRATGDDPIHAGTTTGSGRGGHAPLDAGDAGPDGLRQRTGPADTRHPDDPGPYGREQPLPGMPPDR